MKTILVTGTPGTGKTALSKELAKKLGFYYVDAAKIIKKYRISEGYDKKRKTKIVDAAKLNKALIKEIGNYKRLIQSSSKKIPIKKHDKKIISDNSISFKNQNNRIITKINKKTKRIKKGIIIDSHLSHYLPKQYADLCIVAKCSLKVLKNRLKKKKYSGSKVRENLDAEIFDICLNEARESRHKVLVIDTTKGINIDTLSRKIGGLIGV